MVKDMASVTSPNCQCGAPFTTRAPDTFWVRPSFGAKPIECEGGFYFWCELCDELREDIA
jgi:hypothetical protein